MSRHPRHIRIMRSESAGARVAEEQADPGGGGGESPGESPGESSPGLARSASAEARWRRRRRYLSKTKAAQMDRLREAQLCKLKNELGDLLVDSPLCLADSVFAEVVHEAAATGSAGLTGSTSSRVRVVPRGLASGSASSRQQCRALNMDSDVVSEIAERIIRQKTHEIRGRGQGDGTVQSIASSSTSSPESALAGTKMDARTLDTLRRHVRDRDSGKFF